MITIRITRTTTEQYSVMENMVATEEPTQIVQAAESQYDRAPKVTYNRTYKPVAVNKSREITTTLLEQNIEKDEEFKLADVILAINGLEVSSG